jgi:hypothetical protein
MINMIKNISTLQKTDKIILDANICLIIYGPQYFGYQDMGRSRKYADSQNKWGKDCVFICRPVLSEFVNRCIHYYWTIWKQDEKPVVMQ